MKHPTSRFAALLLFTSHLCATPVQSADAPKSAASAERVVYDAAFFAAFAPRTALDMVKQTPGFVLADEEARRGFSGAVGNVLIDGQRLSAKSQTSSDVLQRVPANEVLRIEILRGGAVAGDASGSAVLANVVRTPSTGGGAWGLGLELADRSPAPNGWFAWGGRRGVTEYSLGGNSYALHRELPGDRAVYDGAGTLLARRHDESPREFAEYALNGQVARPLGSGRVSVTGQVSYSRYADQSTLLTTTPAGAPLEDEAIPYTESDRIGEAGLTWQRPLGGWELELNALVTRKRHRSHVSATRFDAADVRDRVFTQRLEHDSGESILRGSLARDVPNGRLEAGAELAVNTLEGNSRLTLDLGDGPFVIPVPNANLRVEETRAEVFISRTVALGARWSLETRLAAETSRLGFTGDTEQSVSLSYLKPHLQISRTLGAHQLQARFFREVGQLDFRDFVSSAELSDDLINGGNPDLRPQTAWATELIGDFRFDDTAVRVRLFRHWLDDVNDLVPVGPPGEWVDAPGNIGRGSLFGGEMSLRVPLKFLTGASLSASGTFQEAEARDPVTGLRREISEFVGQRVKAEFRQDLPASKFTWGLAFTGESGSTAYRFAETDSRTKSSSLDLFVEAGWVKGFKLRLSMVSALGDPETRERRFYEPDRAGLLSTREVGGRFPGHWWLFTLSGGF